jgi:hypothetical protein
LRILVFLLLLFLFRFPLRILSLMLPNCLIHWSRCGAPQIPPVPLKINQVILEARITWDMQRMSPFSTRLSRRLKRRSQLQIPLYRHKDPPLLISLWNPRILTMTMTKAWDMRIS